MIEQLESRVLLATTVVPNGLRVTYFDNADLSGRSLTRIDTNINFKWGYGSPDKRLQTDTFSARWTGEFEAPKTEAFTFFTSSDDGVRLYIDGKPLINKWTPQRQTEYAASTPLVRGQRYTLRMEYFERSGAAAAQLSFASRSISKQLIPNGRLFATQAIVPVDEQPVDPPAPTGAPAAPSNLKGAVFSASQIDLTWNDVTGETGYTIERAFDAAGPWDALAKTSANTTRFSDQSTFANTQYSYRVRAFNGVGASLPSVPPVSIKTGLIAAAAPIKAAGRYLVDATGKPFLFTSDTAWFLTRRLSREQIDLYLRNRAGQDFNVIQTLIDLTPGFPNYYKQSPLINKDPTRFNDAFFSNVDYIVNRAQSLGLVVMLAPMSSGAFQDGTFTTTTAFNYGQYLGRRYRNKPIIWLNGMDSDPSTAKNAIAVTRAIANGIAMGAADGDQSKVTQTFMAPFNTSSSKWFANDAWLDFNYIQSGHHVRDNWNLIAQDLIKSNKPTIDGETTFEDIPDGLREGAKRITDWDQRKMRYWAMFAGAAGVSYGHNDVWQLWSPEIAPQIEARNPWFGSLDTAGASQIKFIRALMESRPMSSRIADQSLLASGGGTGADHQQATRDAAGSYALLYTPNGKPITVNLDKLSGASIKASWFNPRTGQTTLIGTYSSAGNRTFTPPTTGAGQDWVLIVDDVAKNYTNPVAG